MKKKWTDITVDEDRNDIFQLHLLASTKHVATQHVIGN
jgi:hypothetical protein